MLADVASRQGRDDDAVRLAEESRAFSSADDLDAQPTWRAALARTLARRGEYADAERLAHEALDLLEPTDFVGLKADAFDALADVHRSAGQVDDAVAAVEQALALHEQKGNVVSAERSRSVLNELRAERGSATRS
jgi:tetratricopeptide (TPR) repeat protein